MRSWKRRCDADIEARLRSARPEPRPELTSAISDRARPRRSGLMHGLSRVPLGVAGGLSAIVVVVVLALGGAGAVVDTASNAAHRGTSDARQASDPTIQQYEAQTTVCIDDDVTYTTDPDTAAILVLSGAATYGPCPAPEVVIPA